MSNQDWNSMNEQEFDEMLKNALDQAPPENVVKDVTPWRKAMNRVLTGIALNAVTLNFFQLNYILPTVGIILMILGFRTLRNENRWFKYCWYIMIIWTVESLASLILGTTIVGSTIDQTAAGSVLPVIGAVTTFSQLFCLWKAIRETQAKVQLPVHAGSIIAMMVWYAVLCLLGLLQAGGWIVGIVMIGSYALIIRSLYKASKELDEAGYAVATSPVRVSDWVLTVSIVAVMTVGMGVGYLFGGSYSMDWQPLQIEHDTEAEEIKAELIELGFPEEILADLTEEEIKECKNALRVATSSQTYSYGKEEVKFVGVGVELPGQRETWKLFHYFLWEINPKFYGTESIHLWTAGRDGMAWIESGEFTGRLLYDKDGQVYTAPYNSLGRETFTSRSFMWGEQVSTDMFATFSLPRKGENQRGYITYNIEETEDGCIVDSWVNYTHQRTWLQYPVLTAMEARMSGMDWGLGNSGKVFLTIQDALQFYPTEDELEML